MSYSKSSQKEKKHYLWDWSQLEDADAKFENFVASPLLKYCHFLEDTEGETMELRYLRDRDKRQVDFIVLKNKKPIFAVACKTGEKELSKNIIYFKNRTQIPRFYQAHLGTKDYVHESGIRVLPFLKFSNDLLC